MASNPEFLYRNASPAPSSSSSSTDPLDTRDDEGWEDANPDDDTENIQIKSFFDDTYFSDVRYMLNECKIRYNFDFLGILRRLGVSIPFIWRPIRMRCTDKTSPQSANSTTCNGQTSTSTTASS